MIADYSHRKEDCCAAVYATADVSPTNVADAYNALNVLPPTYEPRATGHVTQMIELMQTLIESGSAYAPGNGDVYLEVRKVISYYNLNNFLSSDEHENKIEIGQIGLKKSFIEFYNENKKQTFNPNPTKKEIELVRFFNTRQRPLY